MIVDPTPYHNPTVHSQSPHYWCPATRNRSKWISRARRHTHAQTEWGSERERDRERGWRVRESCRFTWRDLQSKPRDTMVCLISGSLIVCSWDPFWISHFLFFSLFHYALFGLRKMERWERKRNEFFKISLVWTWIEGGNEEEGEEKRENYIFPNLLQRYQNISL